MRQVRLGAVGYLNARPLTWALDRAPQRWEIRYDVPSVCSTLLHAGEIAPDEAEIVVLKQGRIVERGRHEDLIALGGWYAGQWRYQQLEASLDAA